MTEEVRIPEIKEEMGLTIEQAREEYNKLLHAPKPQYGWSIGIANKINCRLEQLKTMVFNHAMKGK